MRYYDELARYEREGFEVIVDKTWEDMHPSECFDDSIDPATNQPYYDTKKMCEDIDSGRLDWFMLRVRVLFEGHQFGEEYLGGCLYEDAREVLTDGVAEDLIAWALDSAKEGVQRLAGKLWALQMELDYQHATAK